MNFLKPQVIMDMLHVAPENDVSGYILIPERSPKVLFQNNITCLYKPVFSKRLIETGQGLNYEFPRT